MSNELKDINRKEMGKRIRARREALNISRAELGKRLSVTGKFISDVECGDKGLSLKNLYKLKQILGLSVDYILDGDEAYRSEEEEKQQITENILGSLSVCSTKQLSCMEEIARIYVESIIDKG